MMSDDSLMCCIYIEVILVPKSREIEKIKFCVINDMKIKLKITEI